MEEHAEKRGVQIFADIARLITESLLAAGLAAEKARQLGLQAADHVRKNFGGEQVYVPKGLALVVSERDREIWRKFNGGNQHQLAKEYHLTERQIYNIVARVREEEFRRRQMGLFG